MLTNIDNFGKSDALKWSYENNTIGCVYNQCTGGDVPSCLAGFKENVHKNHKSPTFSSNRKRAKRSQFCV